MAAFVLRVEAVNFNATIYDTSDLSTVRGSSLAVLRSDRAIERALSKCSEARAVSPIFSGASMSAYRFEATDETAAETVSEAVRTALASAGNAPLDHMCFVVDWMSDTGDGSALDHAAARNRSRQFRQWTLVLPPFDSTARGYDPLDRMRPAVEDAEFPRGREKVSASVAARRKYGREQRQQFYRDEFGPGAAPGRGDDLRFANSFEDIVRHPPDGLPLELGNKMAVLYADGNRFGDIRAALAAKPGSNATKAVEDFSTALVPLQKTLLGNVVDWFHRGVLADGEQLNRFGAFDRNRQHVVQYRLETLLWGGDELIFVVPSWLAFDLLAGFFETTRRWTIGGQPATFAAGLVICHHKTPIRQAISLAHELADGCKDLMLKDEPAFDAASVAIFESLAPPESGLGGHRARLYGARSGDDEKLLNTSLVLPGGAIGQLSTLIGDYKWDRKVPRSQVYRLLRAVRSRQRGFFDPDAVGTIAGAARDYAAGAGAENEIDLSALGLPSIFKRPDKRPLPLELALLAELWSYVRPFEDLLPPFIAGGGH